MYYDICFMDNHLRSLCLTLASGFTKFNYHVDENDSEDEDDDEEDEEDYQWDVDEVRKSFPKPCGDMSHKSPHKDMHLGWNFFVRIRNQRSL